MPLRDQLNNPQLLTKCWDNIYRSKQKSKRKYSKGTDGISIQDFEENKKEFLATLLSDLENNKYKLDPLAWFLVEKEEKGKFRLISVSNVKDRIVHKAILSLMTPNLFYYIDTKVSYCGVKLNIWKKSDSNALTTKKAFLKVIHHLKNNKYYVFKSDIKGFYDNVPKKELFKIIKDLSSNSLKDNSLNSLIKGIIYYSISDLEKLKSENEKYLPDRDKGIYQGSSLSQFFANIYLADFDINMKNKYGDRFIRYIDDFIIFCDTKEEANEAKTYAIELLKKKKLELSDNVKKTTIANLKKEHINFLGIRIDPLKITYKKNVKDTGILIKKILDENNKEYRKYVKLADKVQVMKNRIKGLGEYLKYYHTEEIYKEINKWIKDKKRKKKFNTLESLDIKKIKPIIKIKEWQDLFN